MDKRIIALGVGLVAGIGAIVALRYLLDKDEETGDPNFAEDLTESVAQLRGNDFATLNRLPDNEVTRQIDEALKQDPSTWTRRERPQRHEDTVADAT